MAYPVTSFSETWDETTPTSADKAGLVYQLMQYLKRDLRERYYLKPWPTADIVQTIAYSSGTLTIDCSLANVFEITLGANVSATSITNVPPSGYEFTIELHLIQDATGGRTMSWPSSVKWPMNITPTLSTTASTNSIIQLRTLDGGTTWYGIPGATGIPV